LLKEKGYNAIQDWLSFYFKNPIHDEKKILEHDLFFKNEIEKHFEESKWV
jgi:myo-inositol-1-phosphate synthase